MVIVAISLISGLAFQPNFLEDYVNFILVAWLLMLAITIPLYYLAATCIHPHVHSPSVPPFDSRCFDWQGPCVRASGVGIAQWLPLPGEMDGNLRDALALIRDLGSRGCDLIVLPELWPSGFAWESPAEDVRAAADPRTGHRTTALAEAAQEVGGWLCAGTVPRLEEEEVFDTLPLFAPDGSLRDTHLNEPLKEEQGLTPRDRVTTCNAGTLGSIGLSVCFDGDFPEVARSMRLRGADTVLQPSRYGLAAADWVGHAVPHRRARERPVVDHG